MFSDHILLLVPFFNRVPCLYCFINYITSYDGACMPTVHKPEDALSSPRLVSFLIRREFPVHHSLSSPLTSSSAIAGSRIMDESRSTIWWLLHKLTTIVVVVATRNHQHRNNYCPTDRPHHLMIASRQYSLNSTSWSLVFLLDGFARSCCDRRKVRVRRPIREGRRRA